MSSRVKTEHRWQFNRRSDDLTLTRAGRRRTIVVAALVSGAATLLTVPEAMAQPPTPRSFQGGIK